MDTLRYLPISGYGYFSENGGGRYHRFLSKLHLLGMTTYIQVNQVTNILLNVLHLCLSDLNFNKMKKKTRVYLFFYVI